MNIASADPGPAPPDFDRPVVSILGLPFDCIDVAQATATIRAAAASGRRCFVSTPNLNFTIAARNNVPFRDSVLHSDLSLVDGMPLVWIARFLRLPLNTRVSGSDVFDALQRHAGPALSIYVFGAPPGAAARASERINAQGGGLRCVGYDEGGYGSVESMSSDAHIDRINASGARFVVVSLGAVKGQAWIEHNASRLSAPVLAHFGAVVNFAAGSVSRAPRWMQVSGLEWVWRIKEEPLLWKRYAHDAAAAAWLVASRVVPDAVSTAFNTKRQSDALHASTTLGSDKTTVALRGSGHGDLSEMRRALAAVANSGSALTLDLAEVRDVDAAFVALLSLADGWFRSRGGMQVKGATPSVARAFHRKLVEGLL